MNRGLDLNEVNDMSLQTISLYMMSGNKDSTNSILVENKSEEFDYSKFIFINCFENNDENSDLTEENEFSEKPISEINLNNIESINNNVYYIDSERCINGNYYDRYGRYCGSFENEKFYSCYYYYYKFQKDHFQQDILNNNNFNMDNYICVNDNLHKSYKKGSCLINESNKNNDNKCSHMISDKKTLKLIDLDSILNHLEIDLVEILSSNQQNKEEVNIILEKIVNENYIDFSQIKFSQYLNVYDLLDSTISNKRRRVHLNSMNFLNKRNPFNYENEQNNFTVDISSGILLLINTKHNSIMEFDLNIKVFLNKKGLTKIIKNYQNNQ
ncbi:hypothetical protein FG386_000950 [Cryptosporidium ryanae]|uniref:uncharacterized protein n=1 Tax=Cryptosporidium ryanae TaxID=515981 RepID=UPI00351A4ED5|nr:hypothetical protein FG386_000950 [Cryptosporidium ryanae]